jgi:UPF0716 protein FxsA
MVFLLTFVIVATVEVALFTAAWTSIGAGPTIALTLLTGVVGSFLVRHQGLGIIRDLRSSIDQGRFPGRELAHGAMVLVGGALLLTPGFLTDTVGLALMVPPVRELLRRFGERKLSRHIFYR